MVAITSFSKALYEKYAYRLCDSFSMNWPGDNNLIVYSEDITPGISGCIEVRPLDFPDLIKFKSECPPDPPDYTKDAARFSNKVWAMAEGSMNESGLCFWIDADCVIHRKVPEEFLRRLIPGSCYLGSFQRPYYVETGFWGVRADHPEHRDFMNFLKAVYTSGQIFKFSQWHDCIALDYTREKFKDVAKAVDLTKTLNGRGSHVIATSELGRWIDHCKGARKDKGYSPECRWHAEAHKSGRRAVLGDGERPDHSKVA